MTQLASQEEPIVSSSRSFHGWTRLPDELKLEVLSHNLTLGGKVDRNKHAQVLQSDLFPFIATRNRHLANVAQEVYYNSNVFEIVVGLDWGRPIGIAYPKAHTALMMHHLHVVVHYRIMDTAQEYLLAWSETSWIWLLKLPLRHDPTVAKYPGISRGTTAWQAGFTNLQSLMIEWHASCDSVSGIECCLKADGWNALRACIEQAEITLRAPKVEFETRTTFLTWDPWASLKSCEQDHSEVFQHLKDMIMAKKS